MISDIPHVKYTEGRFYHTSSQMYSVKEMDPTIEANKNWLSARRAIMRNPVDRIGYGGYLSLAYKFPKFVDYIEHVTDEFRAIYDIVKHTKPYTGFESSNLKCMGTFKNLASTHGCP